MNENIDLTKILKDCPAGWEFYSSIYGNVKFLVIIDDCIYPIKLIYYDKNKGQKYEAITKQGLHDTNCYGECTLFPSKEQRDWSKFTAPWYKKEISTIARNEKQDEQTSSKINERAWLYLVSDVLTWKDGIGQYLDDSRVQELAKKLCSKYSQKLYNPSILSNSSNTGKNEQKFDPKTLKPFDKILVERYDNVWVATLFSHYKEFRVEIFGTHYFEFTTVSSGGYRHCIPYNDDTKHLVGTTTLAPEYYRYWED